MLDDFRLKLIEKTVPGLLNNNEIVKDDKNKLLIKFYLDNAQVSLNTAKIIYDISIKEDIKKSFKYLDSNFESYLWVINTSYYSMFYIAGALLASLGIKVRSEIGVHKKTFETLVYYFYLNEKLAKHYIDDFLEAQSECQELLGKDETTQLMHKKAKELMQNYDYELEKRSKFTYNIGERAKFNKAETSLNRAIDFYNECLKVLND